MTVIKKSEYIQISRTLVRKLYDETCFGKGSLYLDNLKRGIPPEHLDKVERILESLVKQEICAKKKKEHGWKYYLEMKRLDKIKEIIKEKGSMTVLLILFNIP